ncbi:MAG: Na+/H+ antiporter NhaA [Polyangiaceae bacterium]
METFGVDNTPVSKGANKPSSGEHAGLPSSSAVASHAPETWLLARRLAGIVLRPLDRFLRIEAASGIVLLVAAAVALAWANSRFAASYEHLLHTPLRLGVGPITLEKPLHFVINDVLMTIFFFVVGLEIRREMHEGELADRQRAMLPAVAALGGMIAPATIYVLVSTPETRSGFGVPTATDIAFAVGVLALLGKRVPPALRVMLLSLAIIDDIGAIVVIALFYSKGVAWSGFLVAALGIAGVLVFQRFGVRKPLYYVLPGAVLWLGVYQAGVHPTIAGVILGLLTPARTWFGERGFLAEAESAIDDFRSRTKEPGHGAHDLLAPLGRLNDARVEALSPAVRLQASLHPWVAYGIMPIFALANAGVSLQGVSFAEAAPRTIGLGVACGLFFGKPIGIFLASFLSVKAKLCKLPRGVGWGSVLVVGLVGGIGFTMAIFIAGLAFTNEAHLAAAKLAVLTGSGAAAIIGLVAGSVILPKTPAEGAATTHAEAESSADV